MSQEEPYVGREQTQIKHFILRKYLERFAHIVGQFWQSITYVDCFAGPWNVQSPELGDSSFAIAIKELRKARTTLDGLGKTLKLRCMFLERDKAAFHKLEAFRQPITDIEIKIKNAELVESIDDILAFVREAPGTFPFIFIDPTGWTGFGMSQIQSLLQIHPGEVLINFMTDYVRRFIDHPDQQVQDSFVDLFGSADFRTRIQGLENELAREEALVQAYAENVKKTGGFDHACAAVIFYPEIDRAYFHLLYATRHRKGVEVFKNVEKQAMGLMKKTHTAAKQRKRIKESGQPEFFTDLPHSRPIDQIRQQNLGKAEKQVLALLKTRGPVTYEQAWDLALSFPLVWDSDPKIWIKEWRAKGLIELQGLRPRQKVPKLGEGNELIWQQGAPDN